MGYYMIDRSSVDRRRRTSTEERYLVWWRARETSTCADSARKEIADRAIGPKLSHSITAGRFPIQQNATTKTSCDKLGQHPHTPMKISIFLREPERKLGKVIKKRIDITWAPGMNDHRLAYLELPEFKHRYGWMQRLAWNCWQMCM